MKKIKKNNLQIGWNIDTHNPEKLTLKFEKLQVFEIDLLKKIIIYYSINGS